MVGDTDPPRFNKIGPKTHQSSRTCGIDPQRKLSAAPEPGSGPPPLKAKTPATAATGAGVNRFESRGAYNRIHTTALSVRAIAKALGGDVIDGRSVLVPGPSHSKSDRSLHVTMKPDGSIRVHSYSGDDWLTCKEYVLSIIGGERRPVFVERDDRPRADTTDLALEVWRQSVPVHSILRSYLVSRGLDRREPPSEAIRFHPACPFGKGQTFPAMVALFRDIHTDEPCGIHRTALRPDGSGKAAMPDGGTAKRMLGRAKGAAIKLTPDENVTHGLLIAEGVETALTLLYSGLAPVWCMGSAGAIERLPVLAGLSSLGIFADHDETGLAAARSCARRWADEGRQCMISYPPRPGYDWNDPEAWS